MIECGALGVQTGDDIAQAFAISKLSETERQKMIIFTQSSRGAPAGKLLDTASELTGIQCLGDL